MEFFQYAAPNEIARDRITVRNPLRPARKTKKRGRIG
jgi:hypothetical protein